MSRVNITSGSTMEKQMAYSRAVVVDDQWVLLSGTTGYNYLTGNISEDIVEQAEQVFANISKALEEAGASISDIVRVVYIVPDRREFPKVWPVLQKWFGDVKPASMMFQSTLYTDEMKIEIEVTARKGCGKKRTSGL